jgi:hypothetical protein
LPESGLEKSSSAAAGSTTLTYGDGDFFSSLSVPVRVRVSPPEATDGDSFRTRLLRRGRLLYGCAARRSGQDLLFAAGGHHSSELYHQGKCSEQQAQADERERQKQERRRQEAEEQAAVYKASGWLSRLRTRQVDDGVALSAELTRWPGGRAL